jgi:hypothetical protein
MAINETERTRRFARRRIDDDMPDDSLVELHAELVLLREENARLKAAEHKGPDIDGLLTRARSLSAVRDDEDGGAADEATRVLAEGLVIRESLLEICRQIERVMVSFEARLLALGGGGPEVDTALQPPRSSEGGGHWSEPPGMINGAG